MNNKFHSYHMIEMSPWPLLGSLGTLSMLSSMVAWFHFKSINFFIISMSSLFLISFSWWRDVVRESLEQGFHHGFVIDGLKMGMILFITSEVFFFVSFFWGYFHSSVSPCLEIGQIWPSFSISPFNPMNVPLLNTIILLSSGVSITWAHHSIISGKSKESIVSLLITVLLGFYFTLLQGMEYMESEFSISDSVYGSSFFMATGFHGLHVIIGTSFLFICLIRMNKFNFNMSHLLGFEAAAWYWHFVDVVWLFLYLSIYWWGK